MKNLILFFIFYTSTIPVLYAQYFVVGTAKKCYYPNGEKIEKGDTVNIAQQFAIKKKGRLSVDLPNGWGAVYTRSGTFNFDSIRQVPGFVRHDSIYQYLKAKGLTDCHFPHTYMCRPIPGGVACGHSNRIEVESETFVKTDKDSIEIKWKHPVEYHGAYEILVMNLLVSRA